MSIIIVIIQNAYFMDRHPPNFFNSFNGIKFQLNAVHIWPIYIGNYGQDILQHFTLLLKIFNRIIHSFIQQIFIKVPTGVWSLSGH